MSMKRWSIVLAVLFATSLFVHVVTAADDEKGDKPRVRKGRPEGAEGSRKRPEGAEGRRSRRPGQRPGMGGMKLMRAIDADGDGILSAAEIEGAIAAIKKLDKNEDGKIDKAELAPPKRKGGERPKRGEGAKDGERPKRGEGGKGRRKRPAADGE